MSDHVTLALHGVTVRVESSVESFVAYVRTAMEPYLVDTAESADVTSCLQWTEGAPPRTLEETFPGADWERRPDRDLYVADGTACWLRIDDFTDFKLRFQWDGTRLSLEGRYFFRLGSEARLEPLRRRLYRGAKLEARRAHRFSTLLYYLVYHPVLWKLSRERGWHVLHGGAVADSAGAVVLTGMPGCGKSTLSVAMLADPAKRMLSDNIVLHDGERVLACPELLLLDERSRRLAGAGAGRMRGTGERRVFGRDAFRPEETLLEPVRPRVLLQVGRARTTSIEPLESEVAAAHVLGDNTMAKEVRRIAIMGEALDALVGTVAPDDRAALVRLLANTPAYALWLGEDKEPGAVIAEVIDPLLRSLGADTRGASS